MRFDEFVHQRGVPFGPVDRLDGYLVEVVVPPDWEAVQSPTATPVLIWRDDPSKERFCANAVLTMARADAALDPHDVFAMLCEWQVHMMPGIHEIQRESAAPHAGPGLLGILDLLINTDVGVLQSVVMSRIIATDHHTLIAQLTFTAQPDSLVQRSRIGFGVVPASEAPPTSPLLPGAPAARPAGVR